MTTKDATDILPWHIVHDLEQAGSTMIPESLYYFISDLMGENSHLVDVIEKVADLIG